MEVNRTKFILVVIAIGLLIAELVIMDYDRFWAWRNFGGLIGPLILIIVALAVIKKVNRDKSNS
ncbi:MAG: hypothetical protein KJO49_09580 [Bacteroidia bacterium]|nr:hypothetical protein [Bacteroidia bacterium]MBT8269087.1 hypothetical protein [Bacteroidia bacterium]NNF82239.1 hypothetical protein [Flavobacteriaceae bacterium]NNK69940.1 hypothetical protein [Flavobacteriaceae bacterium]